MMKSLLMNWIKEFGLDHASFHLFDGDPRQQQTWAMYLNLIRIIKDAYTLTTLAIIPMDYGINHSLT